MRPVRKKRSRNPLRQTRRGRINDSPSDRACAMTERMNSADAMQVFLGTMHTHCAEKPFGLRENGIRTMMVASLTNREDAARRLSDVRADD